MKLSKYFPLFQSIATFALFAGILIAEWTRIASLQAELRHAQDVANIYSVKANGIERKYDQLKADCSYALGEITPAGTVSQVKTMDGLMFIWFNGEQFLEVARHSTNSVKQP